MIVYEVRNADRTKMEFHAHKAGADKAAREYAKREPFADWRAARRILVTKAEVISELNSLASLMS